MPLRACLSPLSSNNKPAKTQGGEAVEHISQIVLSDATLVKKVVIQQKGLCVLLGDIKEDFGSKLSFVNGKVLILVQ